MKKLILIMMMLALFLSAKSQMLIGEKMVYFYDDGSDYIAEVIDTTSTNSLVFWVEFQNASGSGYRGCTQNGGCVKHATSLMDALGGIERWATMEEAVSWGYTKYVQYLRKGMGTSSQYFRGDGELETFPTIPTNTNQLTNGAGFLTSYTETDPQFNTKFSGKSTSDLSEGTNLYYTQSRFNTAFSGKTSSDLGEGTNLYYTTARFNTAFSGKSTTDLTEGTNQYFTNARARAAISLTTTGTSGAATYSSSTGVLNIPDYTPSRVINANPGRSLSTTGSNNTFTISSTRDSYATYTVNFSAALTLTTSNGQVDLDYSTNGGSSWIPVSSVSQVFGTSITITTNQNLVLSGWIPANALVRINRSQNTNVTISLVSLKQQEILD